MPANISININAVIDVALLLGIFLGIFFSTLERRKAKRQRKERREDGEYLGKYVELLNKVWDEVKTLREENEGLKKRLGMTISARKSQKMSQPSSPGGINTEITVSEEKISRWEKPG